MDSLKRLIVGTMVACGVTLAGCALEPGDDQSPTEAQIEAQLSAPSVPEGDFGDFGVIAVEEGPGAEAAAVQLAGYVNLHQISTVWDPNVANQVKIRTKNYGTVATSPFWYNFTINGAYATGWKKQNNPINPGSAITFYCYATGMTLTSCEMNGDIYYIAPDDIYP